MGAAERGGRGGNTPDEGERLLEVAARDEGLFEHIGRWRE